MADSAYRTDLDRYIDRLVAESSPEYTAWNVEQHRGSAPVKWNYVDGCMMTALLNMAEITGEKRYFDFVDFDYLEGLFVKDGIIDFIKKSSSEQIEENAEKLFSGYNREQLRKAGNNIKQEIKKAKIANDKQYDDVAGIIKAFRGLIPYNRIRQNKMAVQD